MSHSRVFSFTGRRAGVLFLLAFLSFPFSATPASKETPGLQDPTRAFEFGFPAGDAAFAMQSYVDFVRKTSPGLDGLRAQYMAADLLMQRGETQSAAEILQQLAAVSLSDEFFNNSVLQKLGDAYMRLGKYKEAAKAYDDVSQSPVKALVPEATLGKAAAALALGDSGKAHLHYQEVTAFYPSYRDHPRLQLPLGMILWEMGKYADALVFFKRDPTDPAAVYHAGLCHRAMSKPSEAIAAFRKLQQEHAGTLWADRARFEMGETFYQQKDDALASKTFEEILRDNPKGIWKTLASYRLACTEIRTKKFKEAEQRLASLNQEGAGKLLQGNVVYLLSEAYAAQNNIPPIVKLLREQAQAGTSTGDANFRLIWALTALGRHEEAAPLANDYLSAEWDPELTPKTLLVQGWGYEKGGKVPEALATYHLVVEHFPDTLYAPRALELMAMNYYRAQQYTPVITQVRHMWNTLPSEQRKKNPNTLFWIAETHLALANSADAVRAYREFADNAKPNNPLLAEAFRGMAVASAQDRDFVQTALHLSKASQAAQDAGDKALAATLTLDTANAHFNGRSYENAASAYRQFQKASPEHPQVPFALYYEGLSLHRSEYYSDAIAAWDRLIKAYPKDPKASEGLLRMAKTQSDMGKSTEAVANYAFFLKAYSGDPRVKEARLQIGQSWYNVGDYAKAAEAYGQFLKAYPNDEQAAQVTQLLQTCFYQMKLSPGEIEKLTAGQAKSAILAEVYWEEAAKLYNEKAYDKALALFQKILFEFPSASVASQASFYRAESFFLMEKYAEAAPAFENFIQYYPDDPSRSQAMFHLAVSVFNQGDFARAGTAFKDFAERFPDDPLAKNAVLNSAVCFGKAGDVDRAVEGYLRYAATFPEAEDLGAVYLQLGDFLEKANQHEKAADAYSRVPGNRTERAQGLYQAAEVYRGLPDPDAQRKMYEELRGASPKNDPYRVAGMLQLAEMMIAKNDLKGARAVYSDVAANAQDAQSVALAKEQLKVLESASQ